MALLASRQTWISVGVSLATIGTCYWVARADGAPALTPIYYSGSLAQDGTPVEGMRNVRVSLWRDPTSTMTASRACETVANDTPFVGGRFRLPLDETCVTVLRAEPELFVEVEVGGTTIGERVRIGAVPYALEADHAVMASSSRPGSTLAHEGVPAGAVMAFQLDTCPTGWAPLAAAAGRTIVGVDATHARGTSFGSDAVTLETAQLPSHTHSVSVTIPLSSVGCDRNCTTVGFSRQSGVNQGSASATGTSGAAGGGQPVTVRDPSLALLYCVRM